IACHCYRTPLSLAHGGIPTMAPSPFIPGIAILASLPILFSAVLPRAAAAPDSSAHPVRVLFVTQSLGFKHSVVNRQDAPLSTAERAMIDWGISSNLFRVDCTQDVAKDFTKENLQNYDIVIFYTTGLRQKWPVDDATFDYFLNDWLKQKGHGFI